MIYHTKGISISIPWPSPKKGLKFSFLSEGWIVDQYLSWKLQFSIWSCFKVFDGFPYFWLAVCIVTNFVYHPSIMGGYFWVLLYRELKDSGIKVWLQFCCINYDDVLHFQAKGSWGAWYYWLYNFRSTDVSQTGRRT